MIVAPRSHSDAIVLASTLDADHVREDRGIELEWHQSVNDFDKCGYDDPRTNDGSARIVQTG
jgi:hypothetical protein